MLICGAKSNAKFCQISYTYDIMHIVNRSIRRTYLYKQFAFEFPNRNRISGIFIKQAPFKGSTLKVRVGKMKVKVKLPFLAPSAGIAEIEQT